MNKIGLRRSGIVMISGWMEKGVLGMSLYLFSNQGGQLMLRVRLLLRSQIPRAMSLMIKIGS